MQKNTYTKPAGRKSRIPRLIPIQKNSYTKQVSRKFRNPYLILLRRNKYTQRLSLPVLRTLIPCPVLPRKIKHT